MTPEQEAEIRRLDGQYGDEDLGSGIFGQRRILLAEVVTLRAENQRLASDLAHPIAEAKARGEGMKDQEILGYVVISEEGPIRTRVYLGGGTAKLYKTEGSAKAVITNRSKYAGQPKMRVVRVCIHPEDL